MADDRILLAHGSGGRLTHELVRDVFAGAFRNEWLERGDDAAVLSPPPGRLAFTTDSYVVKPLFFSGGDIGRLSICGTVNDLAMCGAVPRYISVAFVIEEGFPLADLERIVASMRLAADEAEVAIVTGDTKVVERGSADGLFINTAGIGLVPERIEVSGHNARPGDKVIVNGAVGDHGIAVISAREGLTFSVDLESDVAPLNHLAAAMLEAGSVRVLRDPTRGGLATTLNEIAVQSNVSITIREASVPIRLAVRSACEMLGFDPMYIANEGKLIAIVAAEDAERIVSVMRQRSDGREACVIGEVGAGPAGRVHLTTAVGGTRILDMLAGELLPRIC
jgi:hydrogenase expression/formation protein HypE